MDSIFLTRGGTTVDVGSYLQKDPGADYGEKDLREFVYAENPHTVGGRLAYEHVGVRRMSFPLLLPTGGASLGVAGLGNLLRVLAGPSATLDVKPAGVATADAVRFDVVDGAYEARHNVDHWGQAGVQLGTLRLDVQPYGYLPTWITLASAASVGLPGRLAVNGPSVIGDVAGLGRLTVKPDGAADEFAAVSGDWPVNALAWSLAGRPSHGGFLTGGSWTSMTGSGAYDNATHFAPVNATMLIAYMATDAAIGTTFLPFAKYTIPAALTPAYQGRHRAYAYLANDVTSGFDTHVMRFTLDAQMLDFEGAVMASAQPVATLHPALSASTLFPQLVDLGEISLPPVESNTPADIMLRLWANRASTVAVNIRRPRLHGLHLIPVDGPNGVVASGLIEPVNVPNQGFGVGGDTARVVLDAAARRAITAHASGNLASSTPIRDAMDSYRGGFPLVGASVTGLELVGAQREQGQPTDYPARPSRIRAAVALQYRPRFTFLKGDV